MVPDNHHMHHSLLCFVPSYLTCSKSENVRYMCVLLTSKLLLRLMLMPSNCEILLKLTEMMYFRNEVAHFTVARSTYPDEYQRAGVSHFVLPLRHLDHGELSGARALAQNLPHLRKKTSGQHPASMTHITHPVHRGWSCPVRIWEVLQVLPTVGKQ